MLSADQFGHRLPSRPLFTSGRDVEGDLVIERYKHPPSCIDVPGLANILIVSHLQGPIAIEQRQAGAAWTRRWADQGHVSLTPAATPVARRFKGRPEVLLVQLAPRLLDEVAEQGFESDPKRVSLVPCFAQCDPALGQYMRMLAEEAERCAGPDRALMTGLLGRAIAAALLRRHSTLASPPAREPVHVPQARMRRVLAYMQEADHSPTLPELAGLCDLSPTHFARAFRATTGWPPHRYLMGLRMRRAQSLLEDTTLPIAEVAMRCGFEQTSSFSTAFRKALGVSPRAWRAERRV